MLLPCPLDKSDRSEGFQSLDLLHSSSFSSSFTSIGV